MVRLALLVVSVILSSAAMSNGIRTARTTVPAGPAVVTTHTVVQVTLPPPPPPTVVTSAAAGADSTTVMSSEQQQQQSPLDHPYKDAKRKVPNGPDPIHNRRARWGEAPARGVQERIVH